MAIGSAHIEETGAIRDFLLTKAGLPASDISETTTSPSSNFESDGHVVTGCVGLEANGKAGLLRSLAVNPAALNAGIGRILVSNLEEAVALQKIDQSYQLTTTGVCAVPTFERRTWLPAGRHGAWKATHPAS